jgi:uncharacterized peroxidase-related enzyme
MFLSPPAESTAAERLYESDRQALGFVMNASRLWAWRPEVCESFSALRSQLSADSALSPRELGVLVCATAAGLGDSYCALAWGQRLAAAADPATAARVLGNDLDESLTDRERALAAWARQVVEDPNATRREQIEALREVGLSEREIFEATTFVAFRIAFSTVNDALGARPDRELADTVPAEVRAAVTFGRPVDQPA